MNGDADMEIMEDMIEPMVLDDVMEEDNEMTMNDAHSDEEDDLHGSRNKRSKASSDMTTHSRLLDSHIKIALSLYKVQQNIYLLDFQRIEVYFNCAFLSF